MYKTYFIPLVSADKLNGIVADLQNGTLDNATVIVQILDTKLPKGWVVLYKV